MGDDQTLREALIRAITSELPCELGFRDCKHQRVLDAVLPVVQAHEKALCDAWMAVLKGEKKTALSELSSLRDAVAHLADELECAGISSADAYGQGVLLAQRDAARQLRSLLPQEGQQ